MDLLRFTTAGSVDDGKSTLIGRLLYDSKSIFEDQLEAVSEASRARGTDDDGVPDLALLTDGLRAEREQGITIDVAYRYFATPRRKFIIADTPGHVQYTRNMVTGASTADLAIILVDARRGVQTQSKRHGFLASLLGIPRLVVAINKMDLVDYAEEAYDAVVEEYTAFSAKLGVHDVRFVPVSALKGDNVVERSEHMDWYEGPTLLYLLETINVAADRNLVDFRFPVQTVIRPHQDFRGLAGTVASGEVRPGDAVLALPSGRESRILSVTTFDGEQPRAAAGEPVVIELTDDLDVSRGDMLVRTGNLPTVASAVDAMVCWMSETPLEPGRHYLLRHTTREVKVFVDEIVYRVDVDTLHRQPAAALGLNDIARVRLTTAAPIFFDPYAINRKTGGFILIDPYSNGTVAAGMIRGAAQDPDDVAREAARLDGQAPPVAPPSGDGRGAGSPVLARPSSPDVVWEADDVPLAEREAHNGWRAGVVWLTGLSGSGKTTIARHVERRLQAAGVQTVRLDGDALRHGLNGDLGFDAADRAEAVRRTGEVARLLVDQGLVVLCALVSPSAADRARVRALVPEGRFLEVYVEVDVETARARDPKGLYARADRGEIEGFTGVSAPYEPPPAPDVVLPTASASIEASVETLWRRLVEAGIAPG
ncbi:sulfate adenylyltransferase subunit CysN [Rubrivirga marina]|uniref:Multifunctional fusion protein n=1 Tax=Rubrivirga marina TaxID=1196024 RepID=A0A271J5Z5_9BACT|nr:bifunctional sulfate adenylyltransferase subunit 1/adenylylsulfate kinase [Rubrivirga marina]